MGSLDRLGKVPLKHQGHLFSGLLGVCLVDAGHIPAVTENNFKGIQYFYQRT